MWRDVAGYGGKDSKETEVTRTKSEKTPEDCVCRPSSASNIGFGSDLLLDICDLLLSFI
jgi:hypothetical protein